MVDDAPDVRLSSEPGASREDIDGIVDRIDAWNMAVTGVQDFHQVAIFLRDDAGAIRGGDHGRRLGRLAPRHRAVGRRGRCVAAGSDDQLIHAAEAEARAAGAHGAFLETHSFQAPELYRQLGYETIAEIEDYPPGGSQLIMRKSLR